MARRKDRSIGEKIDSKERKVEKSKRIKHTTWAHEDDAGDVMCARQTYDLSHACACYCMRKCDVWGVLFTDLCGSHRSWLFWYVFPWRTATIRSQKSSAGIPSNLNPASKEMISDSVELYETEVCFLHIQLIGTNVWLPKTHNVPPDVDFESPRSPAKSESWISPNLHCFAVFPTWQYCS